MLNSTLNASDSDHPDCGLQCLLLVALLHDIPAEEAELRHEFGHELFTKPVIVLAARHLGLDARVMAVQQARLDRVAVPAIALDRDGSFFVVAKIDVMDPMQGKILTQRPGGAPEILSVAEFVARWSGELILFAARPGRGAQMPRFDFSWFIPSIVKYRRLFGEVLLICLALQIIGLATPLFFQVVMDKVLVNRALNTLDVISCALLVAMLFETALGMIRSWVFSHTTSKLDVELGARLFRHLLQLPLSYFHARRVGDSIARVRELENIRAFVTGNALTVLLDVLFSGVFITVLFCYDFELTLVVLLSIPAYVVLSVVFTPILRVKLNDKFNRGAESQAFLVETVSTIDTLKAMALEPRWNAQWEKLLAAYVRAALGATNVGQLAGNLVALVSKFVTLAIMWLGAWEVMKGRMTVGELVAFNMLSGQVSSPVLRLAQLWNDFQQVGISMQRLGDILSTQPEVLGRRMRLPRLRGSVAFDQVSFRYRAEGRLALSSVSFHIDAGEIIGVVGRSGSGKSTLTKLIQRLYVAESGRILIDGNDLASIDIASLRRQIGVVPQEGALFNRSVRENIALTQPAAGIQAVIAAAELAGAHEFICELPEGYDTLLGEHGTGLSGGQRQRIAIARALMHDPRILILDEATSALDYESERVIQDSMADICRGRTVLIVAHRLSAVRRADRIIVMDRGRIAEYGPHDELVEAAGGVYAQLHRLQVDSALTKQAQ